MSSERLWGEDPIAVADRIVDRLLTKPEWRALLALAEKHPEELSALLKEEEAKQPGATPTTPPLNDTNRSLS